MNAKPNREFVPISDVRANPESVIKRVSESHRTAVLTSEGAGVAVVQALSDYEAAEEERAFMRAVVQGLTDLDSGKEVDLAEVKRRLGLK